jgi:hypothetical protein
VSVSPAKVKDPVPLMTNFILEVDSAVQSTEKPREGFHAAVEHCLVHNTLLHQPKLPIKIESPVAERA